MHRPVVKDLERAATDALIRRDFERAYWLADRRCRIGVAPNVHNYVLRADAANGLGDRAAAIADLLKAIELAPEDLAANRRLLAWGDDLQRASAANALIAVETEAAILATCIDLLRAAGRQHIITAKAFDDRIAGWAYWIDGRPIELRVSAGDDHGVQQIDPDPFHPLSDSFGMAAEFQIARLRSSAPISFLVASNGRVVHQRRFPPNDRLPGLPPARLGSRGRTALQPSVTVLLPIYADMDATEACLASVLNSRTDPLATQLIIINDASPDPRVTQVLAQAARHPCVRILENATNLGFVGSINRGLAAVAGGDVILLNSDTLAPPGFIDRLQAAAHSAPNIGTVTPLSNNGEFTSFPLFHIANALPTYEEILMLDRIAAKANAGTVIDILNGIGFCLYITRACLDAVGFLSECYERGYFEDVDFCLLARERGFRNVCAPSVFVGHAGSRSFGREKRSLVVRNLPVLQQRYPAHDREATAFSVLDPLRTVRAAIEQQVFSGRSPILLLTGVGAIEPIVEQRARMLASEGKEVLILRLEGTHEGLGLAVCGVADALPQSLLFNISDPKQRGAAFRYLRLVKPARIELSDPGAIAPVVDLVLSTRAPFDILIADGGVVCPRGLRLAPETAFQISPPSLADRSSIPDALRELDWHRARWRRLAKRAEKIIAVSSKATRFAERTLPGLTITAMDEPSHGERQQSTPSSYGKRLGLLILRRTPSDSELVQDLVIGLRHTTRELPIVVLGSTLDDERLMHGNEAWVTGQLSSDELPNALQRYGLNAVVVACTDPLFGHPVESAVARTGIRMASFDWSFGELSTEFANLLLDPRASRARTCSNVARWWSS